MEDHLSPTLFAVGFPRNVRKSCGEKVRTRAVMTSPPVRGTDKFSAPYCGAENLSRGPMLLPTQRPSTPVRGTDKFCAPIKARKICPEDRNIGWFCEIRPIFTVPKISRSNAQ